MGLVDRTLHGHPPVGFRPWPRTLLCPVACRDVRSSAGQHDRQRPADFVAPCRCAPWPFTDHDPHRGDDPAQTRRWARTIGSGRAPGLVGGFAVGNRAEARVAPESGEGFAAPLAAQGHDAAVGAAAGAAGAFGGAGVQGLETSAEVARGVAVADPSADPAGQVDGAGAAGEAAPAGLAHRDRAPGSRIGRAAAPT